MPMIAVTRKLSYNEKECLISLIDMCLEQNQQYHDIKKYYPLIDIDLDLPITRILRRKQIPYVGESAIYLSPDFADIGRVKELLSALLYETSGDLEKAQEGVIIIRDTHILNRIDIEMIKGKWRNDKNKCLEADIIKDLLDKNKIDVEYNGTKYIFDTSKLTVIFTYRAKDEETMRKTNALFGGRLLRAFYIGNLVSCKNVKTLDHAIKPVVKDPEEEYKKKLRRIWKEYGC